MMRFRVDHHRTPWRGMACQYLVGQNHRVRRLRLHLGHHDIVFVVIPSGVRAGRW